MLDLDNRLEVTRGKYLLQTFKLIPTRVCLKLVLTSFHMTLILASFHMTLM